MQEQKKRQKRILGLTDISLSVIFYFYILNIVFLIALVLQRHLRENVKEGWMSKAAEPQTYTWTQRFYLIFIHRKTENSKAVLWKQPKKSPLKQQHSNQSVWGDVSSAPAACLSPHSLAHHAVTARHSRAPSHLSSWPNNKQHHYITLDASHEALHGLQWQSTGSLWGFTMAGVKTPAGD